MEKKLFNNKGSTMVLLIMAIGIISMLGTSILGVTMMNYKIKKANTEIKEAFYLSESGLDKSYVNVYELILEAVEESNKAAEEFIGQFTLDELENYIGDYEYSKYLKWDADKEIWLYNDDAIRKDAEKEFKTKYINYVESEIENALDSAQGSVDSGGEIKILYSKTNLDFSDGDKMTVPIHSEYISDKGIKKTTAVDLVVEIPEYGESYTVETKVVKLNPFLMNVLTARNLSVNDKSSFKGNVYLSKNMYVKTNEEVKISEGNITVKGSEHGGIYLDANDSLFSAANVFAKNILVNGKNSKFKSTGSVYVEDDLEINNSGQKVIIEDSYYGVSDGRTSTQPDKSSGININNASGLEIDIIKDLYLMGTSYVSASRNGSKYQTGESISVKGNYRAYMQPVSSMPNISFNEYISDEDGGILLFADKYSDGSALPAMDKAEYIVEYKNEYKPNDGLIIPSYIKFRDRYTIGSTIKEGSLLPARYSTDFYEAFKNASDYYFLQTEKLGYSSLSNNLTLSNQINIKEEINKITDKNNYVFVNKSGGTHTLQSGTYKGIIIISGGDLQISGDVDFTGAIICDGDITIKNDGYKKFTYEKNVVAKLISKYDLYENVFEGSESIDEVTVTSFVDEGEAAEGNVDFRELLKFEKWKIE